MLMRENEQLVQNKKKRKHNQAKLNTYKTQDNNEKEFGVCCFFFVVVCCTMDTVQDDLCPNNFFIVPE